MGSHPEIVAFDGQAPELASIANKVTELSSLPVVVTQPDPNPWPTPGIEELGVIAFACVPDEKIVVGVRRNVGAGVMASRQVTESKTECSPVLRIDSPAAAMSQNEVGLFFTGQEATLYYVTMLALKALGGRPPNYWPSDKLGRKYGKPTTPRLLEKRRRNARRWAVLEGWIYALVRPIFFLVLIVLIPLVFLGYVVTRPLRWLLGGDKQRS